MAELIREIRSARDAAWLTYHEARSRTGFSHGQIRRLVDRGLVTVRVVPGMHPVISAESLDALLKSSVRAASVSV